MDGVFAGREMEKWKAENKFEIILKGKKWFFFVLFNFQKIFSAFKNCIDINYISTAKYTYPNVVYTILVVNAAKILEKIGRERERRRQNRGMAKICLAKKKRIWFFFFFEKFGLFNHFSTFQIFQTII